MNDELEILQCLIENRIFAPSPSALAKRLAYKGKMTIYRVMEGKVSFRVVHDVWRKLLKEFHITDDIPYFIGRVCYITKLFHNAILPEMNTKHPEWIENVLISLIDDIYVYNSDKFNKEFVPILKDLRRDEPDVYWGMAVLFYIKAKGYDPYGRATEQILYKFLDRLDSFLYTLYPENNMAHQAACNLKSLAERNKDNKNIWWLLYNGTLILRYYTDPKFINTAIKCFQLLNWPARSYWIIPKTSYQEGVQAWLMVENNFNTATNGYYILLQLETGKDTNTFKAQDMCVFQFWTIDTEEDYPILQTSKMVNKKKEFCHYLYDYDSDDRILKITPNPDTGNLHKLPLSMYQVNLSEPKGINEEIWSRIFTKFDKGIGETIYKNALENFLGISNRNNEYTIKDVIITRSDFLLILTEAGVDKTYQLPISAYSFLSDINPSCSIMITEHKDDSEIYVEWDSLGYAIKLSEFTLKS